MKKIQKQKKPLLRIFLIPLCGIVLLQGSLLFTMLVCSGAKSKMEKNILEADSNILRNRQLMLQTAMADQWSSVREERQDLTNSLGNFLEEQEQDIAEFRESKSLQEAYLQRIFPNMIRAVQRNIASGLFLVLTNGDPVEEASDYNGFFIRDSDPQRKTATNTDLLLERGNKNLARKASISLDYAWSTRFSLAGEGKRAADEFFYQPYKGALAHPYTDMVNLGYWSEPFILEENPMDNHEMITYSLPLVYGNEVYGILGVEVSLNLLEEYMDVRELDENLNAGYILSYKQGEKEYICVTGQGSLHEAVHRQGGTFTLLPQKETDLYVVKDVLRGKQKIYALISPMSLYSNNVPYDNTEWELCALVTEKSIFGMGEGLYRGILNVLLVCAVIGICVVIFVVGRVMKPVHSLMNSVRKGPEGIRSFPPSKILEIDELHDVLESATEAQKKTEDQLREEKERYRIAVESSEDIFFTYRIREGKIEIMNSERRDGIWSRSQQLEILTGIYVHPLDLRRITDCFAYAVDTIDEDFRLKQNEEGDYQWFNLSAKVVSDETDARAMITGYLHNINQQKEQELEEIRRKKMDPVTSFYNMKEGLQVIQDMRSTQQEGTLFALHIYPFRQINKQYGLIVGDLLLKQLAKILRKTCEAMKDQPVLVRVSAGTVGGWLSQLDEKTVQIMIRQVEQEFSQLIHRDVLKPALISEMVQADRVTETEKLAEQLGNRLKQNKVLSDDWDFGKIISVAYTEQMSLMSITLNLFDRGADYSVPLDLFAEELNSRYSLDNLVITAYDRENMVNTLEYQWRKKPEVDHIESGEYSEGNRKSEKMAQCTEADFRRFTKAHAGRDIWPVSSEITENPMFASFLDPGKGIGADMTDNGQYSGTIFFMGENEEVLKSDNDYKEIREIVTIIQNRINQEKHDLSAQAKSDFLARMSHEIRTPMNGIMGMTAIALKEDQTEERRVECLEKIRNSSQYLLSLVNDILDMSKIESGKMQLQPSKVNMKKKLMGIHDLVESRFREKQQEYTEYIALKNSWFLADELRLCQVLVNLLGNASKYTPEGGNIRFEAVETFIDGNASEIYFAVKDDGIGVRKEDQQRIFQNFEQVRQKDSAYRQGTGLGLAISNRLIHMMGSNIMLESEPGRGSIFSFTLRLPLTESPKEQKQEESENTAVELKGRRILTVEDNELNMEIISAVLEDYGIVVDPAENGKIALDKMATSPVDYYDMILMDIMMPVMDGLEATREIRKLNRPDARTIPIVAMTANAFEEEQKKSIASGMNEHLTKPLSMEKLEETLRKYLS